MRLEAAEIAIRADLARSLMSPCSICPRRCGADRLEGDKPGFCRLGTEMIVSSYGGHFGEEPPLSGSRGSGTIFFAGCNLACRFCQNHDISWSVVGQSLSTAELAGVMLELEAEGRHNINLVSPTHVTAPILEALALARAEGLSIPIVWNCGGYDRLEVLELLDGVVDIYMPDLKYADEAVAERLSGVPSYPDVARVALREMHRQVGTLEIDSEGIASRGLLVRHLVLPGELAGTGELMQFVATELSVDTYVNVMAQYHPCHRAIGDAQIGRPLSPLEYQAALRQARKAGIHRLAR